MWLRQSTASQEILLGRFVDSTDGNTQETALAIANTDIKVWKEGATTLANKNSGGATHIANGNYYAVLDATDTDTLGKMEVHVHVAGALAVKREFMVLPANVYDALVLGTDFLQSDAREFGGSTAPVTSLTNLFNGTGATLFGDLDGLVAGVGIGGITSSSLADNAITDAKVAADVTIASVTGAVGSVTAKVTPIDVDGITFASAMEAVLAVLANEADVSGSDVIFRKRDGTTAKITITYGASPGSRTASVINS